MTNSVSTKRHESYRVRHPLKRRNLTVKAIETISPSMRRIILTGDELADFISLGFDDHCKVFFPESATGVLNPSNSPNPSTPDSSDEIRPEMRDYTPRMYDNQLKTLTLDFVIHQAGVATKWASEAKVGDTLTVGGPKGSFIIPMDFDGYVLIGDETALPAIARRLEELPNEANTLIIVEIAAKGHEIALKLGQNTQVIWLYRNGKAAGEAELFLQKLSEPALQAAMTTGDVHIWVATETGVARKIRDFLYTLPAVNKDYIKATGYWQHDLTPDAEETT